MLLNVLGKLGFEAIDLHFDPQSGTSSSSNLAFTCTLAGLHQQFIAQEDVCINLCVLYTWLFLSSGNSFV